MYFMEQDVLQLLTHLATQYPGAHMFFDVVHSYFIHKKLAVLFYGESIKQKRWRGCIQVLN